MLYNQQILYTVHGGLRDGLPGPCGVHELRVLDLVLNVNVLVEWELPGERHIDDHTRAPHVQRPVEAALFQHVGVENLGGDWVSDLTKMILAL